VTPFRFAGAAGLAATGARPYGDFIGAGSVIDRRIVA
jgi:hypothetical protein